MAALPERGPNEKETLAEEIRAHIKRRALTSAQAARAAGESPARMLLLAGDKLYSFTSRQLGRIRDRLAEMPEARPASPPRNNASRSDS